MIHKRYHVNRWIWHHLPKRVGVWIPGIYLLCLETSGHNRAIALNGTLPPKKKQEEEKNKKRKEKKRNEPLP